MSRSLAFLLMGILALALAACGAGTPTTVPPVTETTSPVPTPTAIASPPLGEGFEGGLEGWHVGAEVPQDPNRPGQEVAWSVETSEEQASAGSRSVRLQLDGSQDDGTIWLARPLAVQAGEPRTVRLSFDLWSISESWNTLAYVAAYAGPQPPAGEDDFDLSQPANLAEGWQRYSYSLTAEPSPDGELWIAVGISVVWETEVIYYIDELQVEVEGEGSTGSPGPLQPGEGEPRPPAASLQVGDEQQVAGIGSYCWGDPAVAGGGQGVAVCADAIGLITPREPLQVSSPFTATFDLVLEEPPTQLVLRAIPVTQQELIASGDEPRDWQAWRPTGGRQLLLPIERTPSLEISLDPGLYVLDLWGTWPGSNSVNYGFLLQVGSNGQAGTSALTLEEVAIVSNAQDRPTHLEYMERIGPEILERRRAWREPAPQEQVARYNQVLAPFGYRLEAEFNADWNQTFYDLYREPAAEPLLLDLMRVWPPSVSASGDEFIMAAENAPNVQPTLLLISSQGPMPWQAQDSNMLRPAYLGDEQAAVVGKQGQGIDLEYAVWVGGRQVYSGTAPMMVTHPLRGFAVWDGHWALELEDQVIVDGEDLGGQLGYASAFGFQVVGGRPLYFFEDDGRIHLSYDGETLPVSYDEVIHNQCCEPAMFNLQGNENMTWFHALRDGTWYYVEAGVYGAQAANRYQGPGGWSFAYPAGWELDEELGMVQEPATGKTVTFRVEGMASEAEMEAWLESEIGRKLGATEADNSLAEAVSAEQQGDVSVYRYAIVSQMGASETLLWTAVFYDGQRRYEFQAASPPVTGAEYEAILASFRPAG
jgi:hypothetical protein